MKKYSLGYFNTKGKFHTLFKNLTESDLLLLKNEHKEAEVREKAFHENNRLELPEWSEEVVDAYYETSKFLGYSYEFLYEQFEYLHDYNLIEEFNI
jgi:hypothetical protein